MPNGKLETRVSQARYAKLRGVDRATVCRWGQKGLLVLDDESGLVDVAATNSRVDSRPNVYRGGRTARTDTEAGDAAAKALREIQNGGTPMTLAQATLLKETYLGKLRQVEYDTLMGTVVSVEDVATEVAAVLSVVRNRLLGLGSKLAPRFPDPKFARSLIDEEVRLILSELSADPDEAGDAD